MFKMDPKDGGDDDSLSRTFDGFAAQSNRTSWTGVDDLNWSASIGHFLLNRDEHLAAVEIGIQSSIFCVALSSNILVFLLLRFSRRCQKLSRMNLMICHLAAADIFVAFFNVLPQLVWDAIGIFRGNDALCRVVAYFQLVAMFASSYVLIATAIDRYNAICRPLLSHTWSTARSRSLVIAAWVLSLLFSVPQILIFAYREVDLDSGLFTCWAVFEPQWTVTVYVSWIAAAIYFVPSLILVVSYSAICRAVWRSVCYKERASVVSMTTLSGSSKRESGGRSTTTTTTASRRASSVEAAARRRRSKRRSKDLEELPFAADSTAATTEAPAAGSRSINRVVSKAKRRTVKLTMTVNLSYVICWGPYFVSQIWSVYDPSAPYQGKRRQLKQIFINRLLIIQYVWMDGETAVHFYV